MLQSVPRRTTSRQKDEKKILELENKARALRIYARKCADKDKRNVDSVAIKSARAYVERFAKMAHDLRNAGDCAGKGNGTRGVKEKLEPRPIGFETPPRVSSDVSNLTKAMGEMKPQGKNIECSHPLATPVITNATPPLNYPSQALMDVGASQNIASGQELLAALSEETKEPGNRFSFPEYGRGS